MADEQGSIIIIADLDAKKFEQGSKEMSRAIKSLHTKVESLGPTFRKALDGNASAMKQFDARAGALAETIANVEKQMERLGKQAVPTEDYQWLTDAIKKAETQLQRLQERQDTLKSRGVPETSKAWQNLEADIEATKQKIAEYQLEQEQLKNSGGAFTAASESAQFRELADSLEAVKSKLGGMQTSVNQTKEGILQEGNEAQDAAVKTYTLKEALKDLAKNGAPSFLKKVGSAALSAGKNLLKLGQQSGGLERSIGKLTKGLTSFLGRIKTRLFRQAITAIFNGLREGITNISGYLPEVEEKFNQLKAAAGSLKNAFGAAFAPILTAIAPALITLINLCVQAVTWIGKLMAALTGATSFTKAKTQVEGYGEALGGAGAAAKELKRQLAGFDELNILSDDKNAGGGGGGGGLNPADMFEEVPIESSISAWAKRLVDAFKNQDYTEVGVVIGEGINLAIGKATEYVQKIDFGKIGSSFAQGLNGAFGSIDFSAIASLIIMGVNGAFDLLGGFSTTFDWAGAAAAIGAGISTAIREFNWEGNAESIGAFAVGLITAIASFLETVDFYSLGQGIAKGIAALPWKQLFSAAGQLISAAWNGIMDLAAGAFKEIGTELSNWSKTVDWNKVFKKAGDKIETIFQTFASQSAKSFKRTFEDGSEMDLTAEQLATMVEVLGRAIDSGSKWRESLEKDRKKIEACGFSVEEFTTGGVKGLQNAYRYFTEKVAPNFDTKMQGTKTIFERVKEIISKLVELFKILVPHSTTFVDKLEELGIVEPKVEENTDSYAKSMGKVNKETEAASTATGGLNDKLDKTKNKLKDPLGSVKVDVDKSTTTAKTTYDSFKNKTITATLKAEKANGFKTNKDDYDAVKTKTATATLKAEKASGFKGAKDDYDAIRDKTVTVTAEVKIDKSHLTLSEAKAIDPKAGGGIITAGGVSKAFAGGGLIGGSWWKNINKYAAGTRSAAGSLFMAGEAGPELVAHVNGRSEVLNKSQIASAIYSAVVSAMRSILSQPIQVKLSGIGAMAAFSGIGYTAPTVAGGTVLPYELASQVIGAIDGLTDAVDSQTVDLISAITQNRQALAQAIVDAIMSMGTGGGLSTAQLIKQINRQTRQNGKPVFVGV